MICARKLGVHAQGQNHKESVVLLRSVDQGAASHLDTLLNLKTDAGYGHQPISNQKAVRAGRAMEALMRSPYDTAVAGRVRGCARAARPGARGPCPRPAASRRRRA